VVVNINLTTNLLLDATPSDYYVRKFEVLTTNSYDVYDAAFSSSIYPKTQTNELGVSNKTWLCNFVRDVDLGIYTSHRGGQVSDIYFSIIKRSGQNTFDWSNVTAHWDFDRRIANYGNSLETISTRVNGGVGSIAKANVGDTYFGDFVEFNRDEIREYVISEVIHRFSTNDNPNGNGYYYTPFRRIPIRVFSDLIEVATPEDNIFGLPGDFITKPNGNIEWRDLLTPGYFEDGVNGVDYPFLNGANYIYINHTLYVRRQVPPNAQINQSGVVVIDPEIIC
jgi:hypothetical protein